MCESCYAGSIAWKEGKRRAKPTEKIKISDERGLGVVASAEAYGVHTTSSLTA